MQSIVETFQGERPSTDAYRRAARTLRGRLRHRPVKLQKALARLAKIHDAVNGQEPTDSPPSGDSNVRGFGDQSTRFAAMVAGQTFGSVLCYSQRLELIHAAAWLGLSRFEANLIIASVLHGRRRQVVSVQRPQPSETCCDRMKWPLAIGFALAIELPLAAAAWFFLHG